MKKLIFILTVGFICSQSLAQINSFPYNENFDSVTAPNLPQSWTSSQNTPGTNDFVVATGTVSGNTVKSAPQAIITTNPRINKFLISPRFNFANKVVDNLQFWDRRSSAGFDADVVVEASTDSISFAVIAGPFNWEGTAAFVLRTVQLDDSLSGKENVWFRWRVIGTTTGTTGTTYRIDEIQLTVKKVIDLGVTSILLSPLVPRNGEDLIATIGITNKALAGNFSFTVELFDSLTFIASTTVNALFLSANETTIVQLNYPNIKAGRHPLAAKLLLNGDEDTTNNSILSVINVGYKTRTILINEIMYAPLSGMPEWVECVNNSSDTIPIAGWKISDAGTTKAAINPSNKLILPYSYFVITTDTAVLQDYYPMSIPLFQASFSALNNSGDAVVLFDQSNSVVDSLTFASSWGGSSGGKSLERIDTAIASTLQANWKTSIHPLRATPGFINSVSQKEFDVAVERISISPLLPVVGNSISISSVIKNIGKQQTSAIALKLYLDTNKDSILTANEIQFQQNIASLKAGDSLTISATLPSLSQGTHWFFASVEHAQDADTTNNVVLYALTVGIPPQSIIINEIMYAPTGDIPEWIECYNNTLQSIAVNGWKISDAGTTRTLITNSITAIPPQTYFIVAADSTFSNFYFVDVPVFTAKFSALNNTTPDAVVLFDERNAVIDSIYYKQSWGGTGGMSLQRFDAHGVSTDSANWRSAQPTPGVVNAIARKGFDASVRRVTISPSSIIVNQQISVTAVITNIGKQQLNNLSVEIYLDANNDSIAAASELQFQQHISSLAVLDSAVINSQLTPAQSGQQRIFVKIISSLDEDTTNNIRMVPLAVGVLPQSIVITEIMYAPSADIPEWVELFNTSYSTISIQGWKVSDAGTTKATINGASYSIAPQSYFIVARDTSFQSYYSVAVPVFTASFSTLNNTTPDAVVLFDNQNRIIDSVYYKQSWGGLNGNSLQRFDIYAGSVDSSNWKSALPSAGSENIIARKDFDAAVKNISSAKSANGTRITATIENPGRQTATNITVRFFHDANSDSIKQSGELIHSATVATISPLDSATVIFDWNHSLQGKQAVIVFIEFTEDQRISNNTKIFSIANSFASQTLVINEIMYEPSTGNAEFVELFNRSSDTIDVADWKLMDQPSTSGSRTSILLSALSLRIPPNNFILVANDSSVFRQFPSLLGEKVIIHSSLSLNNSGEDIVLVDLTNTQIDSMRYFPSWHLKNISTAGRSLERINPNGSSNDTRNWSSSVAKGGASPFKQNSIFIGSVASTTSLSLTPNPFSPDNDGYQDFLSINYTLPTNSSTIRVRIYDVTGRLIRRLVQNEPASSTGSLIWNGLDDDGHRVRIGMYIILFEALDNFGGVVKTMKDVAVVARKL